IIKTSFASLVVLVYRVTISVLKISCLLPS
uniref:Uncharacterized protein n=1 Tax=Aegilops tauschii subsp. strangulata TaxID=200361 RepID=A0A453GFE6_AEGTS